jgi:hypothetical protein
VPAAVSLAVPAMAVCTASPGRWNASEGAVTAVTTGAVVSHRIVNVLVSTCVPAPSVTRARTANCRFGVHAMEPAGCCQFARPPATGT